MPGAPENTDLCERSQEAAILAPRPGSTQQNAGSSAESLRANHQQIFLTQESNQDLLHCRQILYPLRYQESPVTEVTKAMADAC